MLIVIFLSVFHYFFVDCHVFEEMLLYVSNPQHISGSWLPRGIASQTSLQTSLLNIGALADALSFNRLRSLC